MRLALRCASRKGPVSRLAAEKRPRRTPWSRAASAAAMPPSCPGRLELALASANSSSVKDFASGSAPAQTVAPAAAQVPLGSELQGWTRRDESRCFILCGLLPTLDFCAAGRLELSRSVVSQNGGPYVVNSARRIAHVMRLFGDAAIGAALPVVQPD